MTQKITISLLIALGIGIGATISPIFAQQQTADSKMNTCFVGEGSNAACAGNMIYFAGNNTNVDAGAWLFQINSETGEIWYKNGKKLTRVAVQE